jgi:hypothetical protein
MSRRSRKKRGFREACKKNWHDSKASRQVIVCDLTFKVQSDDTDSIQFSPIVARMLAHRSQIPNFSHSWSFLFPADCRNAAIYNA